MLWSQLLDTRTDLSELHRVAPELAARLDEVRVELDRPASPTTPVAAIMQGPAGSAWLVDRQMALADQWDELVAQVRALPGFEAFLRPPQIEELRPAAAGGPVVVVNVSQWRCDALLVTDTDTRVVELSAVTHDIVHHHATSYLDALQNYESTAATPATMHTVDQAITTTLEWLCDAITHPILTGLSHEQGPDPDQAWPRVWWCPTGPLAVLPLHAAGYHHPAHNHRGRSVLDRAVSSYTPTLRALAQARRTRPRPVSTPADSHLLIVALRHTPGQPELPSVDHERDLLVRLLPSRHTLREGPAATRQAVRHELTRHAWAHLSCHGTQYPDDPSRGGLLLYDGMLTVVDLTADDHQGEFVFLSACKTAISVSTSLTRRSPWQPHCSTPAGVMSLPHSGRCWTSPPPRSPKMSTAGSPMGASSIPNTLPKRSTTPSGGSAIPARSGRADGCHSSTMGRDRLWTGRRWQRPRLTSPHRGGWPLRP